MYVDNIKDIILLLNPDEKKEFRAFINRQRQRKNRKDLELFEILNEPTSFPAKEIVHRLYGNDNLNAYHSIRKRLLKHLIDYIVIKRVGDDTTSASSVMGLLSLSNFLFENGNDRVGWIYLKKSESLAIANEQFGLLNNIYNTEIEYSGSEYAPNLENIIEKWRGNKRLSEEDERANIAMAVMKLKLNAYNTESKEIKIHHEVTKVMYEYDLYNAAMERPKILYNLLSIVRSAILAKKEYYKFEPLVINSYNQLNDSVGFQKKDHYYKLSILYMIAHILYRNKKFVEALKYLAIMKPELGKYKKSYHKLFFPKYILLYAATNNLMGNVKESVRVVEEALAIEKSKLGTEQVLQMKVNLGVYYFELEKYKEANKMILSIEQSDKWCEKKMGKEWVLRKNLGEIIVLYERGNADIAFDRIKSFESHHKNLLKLPMYDRVNTFISFIKISIDKPFEVASKEFYNKVDTTIEHRPVDKEDVLASAFYCWLKAKMLKKPFYHVLVETLNGRM